MRAEAVTSGKGRVSGQERVDKKPFSLSLVDPDEGLRNELEFIKTEEREQAVSGNKSGIVETKHLVAGFTAGGGLVNLHIK